MIYQDRGGDPRRIDEVNGDDIYLWAGGTKGYRTVTASKQIFFGFRQPYFGSFIINIYVKMVIYSSYWELVLLQQHKELNEFHIRHIYEFF
jgi:hypothetical protein